MARIRTIKPEFWTHEKVLGIYPLTRLLFIGMWNFADDYGRMAFAPLALKARIFPMDDVSAADIKDMLHELSRSDLLMIYSADDKEYIQITGWDHQKIDKRQVSKIPGPFDEGSDLHQTSPKPADSRRPPPTPAPVMEGKGRESNSEANASGAEAAPIDHRKRLFEEGLPKLARLTGKGPDACRSFVGKCLKAASDDAVVVLGLIEEAERNQIVDPSAWIVARLKSPEVGNGKPQNGIIQAADNLVRKLASFDGPARRADELRGAEGETAPRLLSHG